MSRRRYPSPSGRFPRIPQKFSNDLQQTIQWMLQVKPADRPTCDELLARFDELRPELAGDNYMDADYFDPIQESNDPMLGTINLPPDLKLLDKRLPRSNYGKPSQNFTPGKARNNSAVVQQNNKPTQVNVKGSMG